MHRAFSSLLIVAILAVFLMPSLQAAADEYPPYWDGGTGTSVHYPPVEWPADSEWIAYTQEEQTINDQRVQDPSNGGTRPQNYVNVSSGCPDQSLPSVYWQYDSANQILFYRWRVEQIANNYATGPNAGQYQSTSPWNSAQWTVFFDIDGDGFREFAVHIDGSSGAPSTSVDILRGIYSDTLSQSIDFGVSDIYLLAHNPSSFVDRSTDIIYNFQNSLTPTTNWPNGSAETIWDYGTTRSMNISTPSCTEYFVDYQIPLAMLDATSVGGPALTADTPFAMFFATANSLQNPLQKDAVLDADFTPDPDKCIPFGDIMTMNGGMIKQPIVDWVRAEGCGPVTLTSRVRDALEPPCGDTLMTVDFYYYYDGNANGLADDGGNWTYAASASNIIDKPAEWTASWATGSLPKGQYLIGVKAIDDSGNITWSHLTQAEVNSLIGSTPPNYPNSSPIPGIIYDTWLNTCGINSSISKSVNPGQTTINQPVQFTVTINNPTGSPFTVGSITDSLPPGFTYASTDGGTLTPSTYPTAGAQGNIIWTFSPPVSIAGGGSGTLIFTANASSKEGTYTNTVSASTSEGTVTGEPVQISVGAPRLNLSKSASLATATPGQSITYTINYSNDSPANVTGVVISDPLPQGLDFVSASNGGTYDGPTRTITWSFSNLASGEGNRSVSFVASVSNPYPQSAPVMLVNTASIVSNETPPISASATVMVNIPRPQLAIQKNADKTVVDPAAVSPGNQVNFTIGFANIGNAQATGVSVTDVVPTGFTYISSAAGTNCPAGSYDGGSRTVTWTVGTVAGGATGACNLVLQADNPYTGSRPAVNTATIASNETPPLSDSFYIGALESACTNPTVYYFRTQTANVGFDGTQEIANTTAPTSPTAARKGPYTITQTPMRVAWFYQDVPYSTAGNFVGNITSSIFIDKNGSPQAVATAYVYDYDPATGAKALIGTGSTTVTGNRSNYNITISAPPSIVISQGHRLYWEYWFNSNHQAQTNTMSFWYDGVPSPSSSSVCFTPITPVLDKQVSALSARPGDTLTYTVNFGNNGRGNLTGSQIIDTLPIGTTFVSATLNGPAVAPSGVSGQVYTFNVRSSDTATSGQITGGQSGTLVITVTVNKPLASGILTLTNTAELRTSQTQPITDQITTRIVTSPNVAISKSADKTLLKPGDTVTYTLTALNTGTGTAANVTITDSLPVDTYFSYVANSTYLNGSLVSPDPVSGGVLTLDIGTVGPGAASTITFEMRVANTGVPDGVTYKNNFATGQDADTGPYTSNTVTVAITSNANLTITKATTPASGPVSAGSDIQYTITIGNTGASDAVNVRVTDPVPQYTSYKAATLIYESASQTDISGDDFAYFDAVGNRVVYTVGTLPAGQMRTMKFTVTVNVPMPNGITTIGNTATVTSGNTASKQATASIDAQAAPILGLTKSAPGLLPFPLAALAANAANQTTITVNDPSFIGENDVISINGTVASVTSVNGSVLTLGTPVTGVIGDPVIPTFEFVFMYKNSGDANATNVVVSDTLPAGLDFISADNGGTEAGGTVTWNLGTLSVGEEGVLGVRVRPAATGIYYNSGTISSTEIPATGSNTTTTVLGALQPKKSTTTPVVTNTTSGTHANYTITMTNQLTTVTATGVRITDILPTGFTFESTTNMTVTGAGSARTSVEDPTLGDRQPIWGAWSIGPGGTLTIEFTVDIDAGVPEGTYQNTVTGTSTNLSVLPFDELLTTVEDVVVDVPVDLAVTKNVDNNIPREGDNIVYTITLLSNGPNHAFGVKVSDLLPAGVTYVSSSATQGTYIDSTGVWTLGAVNSLAGAALQITASVDPYTGGSTIQNCASLSFSAPSDSNGANNSGCVDIIPTLVILSDFKAYIDGGNVVVQWETASENGTAGFYLYRLDEKDGQYRAVSDRLLPGLITSPQGGVYSFIDRGASPGKTYTYKLVEVESKGGSIAYGPFSVTPVDGRAGEGQGRADVFKFVDKDGTIVVNGRAERGRMKDTGAYVSGSPTDKVTPEYGRKSHGIPEANVARIDAAEKVGEEKKLLKEKRTGSVIKIPVKDKGIYYIGGAEISGLMSIPLRDAVGMIRNGRIAMSSRGKEVSYMPSADYSGIFFYGEGIESIYTDENIYWLYNGKGLKMQYADGYTSYYSGGETFTETLHVEKDVFTATALFDDPDADYWFWDYIVGGIPSLGSRTYNFQAESVSSSPLTASVAVHLMGATDTGASPDHHAVISLNGTAIGEDRWNGTGQRTIVMDFNRNLLKEGANTLKVSGLLDTEAPYSIFFVDSFDVTYGRLYEAVENKLIFKAGGNPAITVRGFTSPDVSVFEITDPFRPKLITPAPVEGDGGNYRVSFRPSGAESVYMALSGDAINAAGAFADIPSLLLKKENSADYLLIAPEGLKDSANKLAGYRQKQGYKTMVVLLEDVMDAFNYGIYSPEAIRNFLAYSYSYWRKPPKYVVLVGEGNYDYKGSAGFGGNLIPPIMVGTPNGLFPSDVHLADVNGDSVPEIAIGRLTVLTDEELNDVINKISVYEGSRTGSILMLADKPDAGGNFPSDSDDVSVLFSPYYRIDRIYLSSYQKDYARQMLFGGLESGADFMNYFGHSSIDRMSKEGLLTSADVGAMKNSMPPVMTAMTCVIGQFAIPGYDSLSELLLIKRDGGVVSAWAPSGWSFNSDAKALNEGFYGSIFGGGEKTVGGAIVKAMRKYKNSGGKDYMLGIYNLIGDPALRLR
jgi:uncharacterized repeat protein (TIGR01451 family)